MRNNEYVDS